VRTSRAEEESRLAVVAVLTLAFGIGATATTSILALVNGVVIRPLPVGQPERLAYIATWNGSLNDLQVMLTRPDRFDLVALLVP
jgi:hypothetical protein